MFKGVVMLFTTFITEWDPIVHWIPLLVSVGGLKLYIIEVESPTYTVLSKLFWLFHVTSESEHPPTITFIGLLKLRRVSTVPEFYQVQPKHWY